MDVEGFRALLADGGEKLLTELEARLEAGDDPLALGTRLRRDHPPSLVSTALTQATLRLRARQKFGVDAATMFFTSEGLQQATRTSVAEHRARRFTSLLTSVGGTCADLCCGIGGDLIALARAGWHVDGVDRDPLTVEVARANVTALGLTRRASVRLGAVEDTDIADYDAVFCDPSRRVRAAPGERQVEATSTGATRRIFQPARYSPPLPRVLQMAQRASAAGVKVAPGVPHTSIPKNVEAEWISVDGDLKEATLWCGALAGRATRRATLLPSGASLAGGSETGAPAVTPPLRYLYEPDDAVLRAGLVADVAARVDGALLDPSIAFITSDRLISTPYARAYEISAAWQFSLKRLRRALRERGVGTVTIKKRGSAVDVERLRKDLRLTGSKSATVVLTRVAGVHHALLCQPIRP